MNIQQIMSCISKCNQNLPSFNFPSDLCLQRPSNYLRVLGPCMFKAPYGFVTSYPPSLNLIPRFTQPNYSYLQCSCSQRVQQNFNSEPTNDVCYQERYRKPAASCSTEFKLDVHESESFLTEKELDLILERALEGYDSNRSTKPCDTCYNRKSTYADIDNSISNGYQNFLYATACTPVDNATLSVAMAPTMPLQANSSSEVRRKPRKQPNPQKSAEFEDPNFQGIILSMHAKLEGTESKLTIYSSIRGIRCKLGKPLHVRRMSKRRSLAASHYISESRSLELCCMKHLQAGRSYASHGTKNTPHVQG